jgi:poly-gamma-glutamate capsule biosynthesis protein CapA/YwtB (metallophosphatase superfamily)
MVTLSRRSLLLAPFFQPSEFRFVALGQALMEHDLCRQAYPGLGAVRETLSWGQVVFSNLESPIRGGEERADPDVLKHSAPVEVLDCLRDCHVNLISLANNHAFDFGAAGVARSIEAGRKRGFGVAGTGRNIDEAAAPGFVGTRPGRVAMVAFASKMNSTGGVAGPALAGANHLAMTTPGKLDSRDTERILAAIGAAVSQADYVVAYHHDHYWEKDNSQTAQWKIDWAHRCIEAGASMFISHGAPLLQGIEIYRGRAIFYDLGNFVFQTRKAVGDYPASAWQGAIARCSFKGPELARIELLPVVLNEKGDAGEQFFDTRGRPSLASGHEADSILAGLDAMSRRFGCRIRTENSRGLIQL